MLVLLLLFVFLAILPITHQQKYSCNSRASCGCSMKWATPAKIVGGETVKTRSWGWIVSLIYYPTHKHFCSGSILSESWILTAAHCISGLNESDIIVNAGSNKLYESTQKRRVAKIISHPFYDSANYLNDIALIQLSSPFNINDTAIAKICLPPQIGFMWSLQGFVGFMNEYPPVTSVLVAVGWRRTMANVSIPAKELQQMGLKAITYETSSCRRLVSSPAMQFCAGIEQNVKDACQDDSGGPLMRFTSSRRWVVAGVRSFGVECGRTGYSVVYARVAFYLDWINTAINANGAAIDSVLTAHDTFFIDETIDDIFLEELITDICSRNYLACLLYLVIFVGLF